MDVCGCVGRCVCVCVHICICTWRENMWTGVCALSVGDVLLSAA